MNFFAAASLYRPKTARLRPPRVRLLFLLSFLPSFASPFSAAALSAPLLVTVLLSSTVLRSSSSAFRGVSIASSFLELSPSRPFRFLLPYSRAHSSVTDFDVRRGRKLSVSTVLDRAADHCCPPFSGGRYRSVTRFVSLEPSLHSVLLDF